MQITNLAWTYWVQQHAKDFNESFLQKVQGLPNFDLRFKIRSTKTGNHSFIITPDRVFETNLQLDAKSNGFVTFLKKNLEGKKIDHVEQHEWDKVLVVHFRDYYLIIEIFANGNIILCDKNWKILQPYHREEWKDRKLQKGEMYIFPQSALMNWKKKTLVEFSKIIEPDQPVAKSLIMNAGISPILADEIVEHLKLPKTNLNPTQLKTLFTFIQTLPQQPFNPCLITKKETWLSPFSLPNHEKAIPQTSLDESMEQEYAQKLEVGTPVEMKEKNKNPAKTAEKQTKALEFARNQQGEAVKKFEDQIQLYQEQAQQIMANQSEIEELLTAIKTGKQKHVPEKEMEEKLLEAKKKGKTGARLIHSINLKQKKLEVEL